MMENWPPLRRDYWELQGSPKSSLIKVRLRGTEQPIIQAPAQAIKIPMQGRLRPLLDVASIAAWQLGPTNPNISFAIQYLDEQPEEQCLSFDAAANSLKTLLPDPYALGSHGYLMLRNHWKRYPLPAWHERVSRAFWRGSSTGTKFLDIHQLSSNLRYKLCRFSINNPHLLDARITSVLQCLDKKSHQEIYTELKKNDILAPRCEPSYFGNHKFIIDIDGNVNSWGLLWKLLSGSCVLRVGSHRRQWYHHKLVPYQHIVPVKEDLSNLKDALIWCQSNPGTCEYIARSGQKLAEREIKQLGKQVKASISTLCRT